ncbi:gamma-glutamyltransferase [Prauserella cavernicola]|uniref:Gamma-glutamyltransferase n=1 Tax=Prauserella cavernicola TaxID=2800127 RepID=A0A934QQL8_9PSEU|nr:gamma-glutamyltransferase [Prauserella cavernicola]MBK1783919.1 gamma-glutamyltransferase [Prauserella cavernicola]
MGSHRLGHIPVAAEQDHEHGSVVAPRERSVTAGLEMLERGGNAVDAAVAAALVAGVVEPTETTLAGCGFLLYADRATDPRAVEFGPRAPLAADARMFDLDPAAAGPAVLGLAPVLGNANVDGPRAAGVPRTLLGLLTAHERWGALDRRTVCGPAVDAAHDGFPADTWFLTNAFSDLERLRADEGTRTTFLADDGLPIGRTSPAFYGSSLGERESVRQPVLAATLEEIACSPLTALTEGAIAQRLVETSRERGGLLTMADLAASGPRIGPALTIDYRGALVAVPPAPGGGLTELQILRAWEALQSRPRTSHESPETTRALALVLRHAFADRYHWLGDPDVVPVPTRGLLSDGYAARLAALCAQGDNVVRWESGHPWFTYAGSPAHDPWPHDDGRDAPQWSPATATPPTSGTTHISATDRDGRTVAITHTAANHFGSAVLCPRTGLLFDSAMAWFNAAPGAANSIAPGARPLANMGPALVLSDAARHAVGASGGRRIISAVAQVVINLVDGGHSPREALCLPRLDASGHPLLVHEDRAEALSALGDLDPELVAASNEPFTIDFARPNIASVTEAGRTSSAIPSTAHSA